jgi:hypothetical protein
LVYRKIVPQREEKITRILDNILSIEIIIDIIAIPSWEDGDREIRIDRFFEDSTKYIRELHRSFYSVSSCLEIFYLWSEIFDPELIFP